MRKIGLLHLIMFLFICASLTAQNITVTGRVTEAGTGEPLIGGNVAVKGAPLGTIADMDGYYSLSVPSNSILVFSYIGFEAKEIRVGNQRVINVALSENLNTLDEVVIVGASFKKSDLTGAVGSVSTKVLQEKPVTNVNQAIQGRVAGVLISNGTRPGDDASIKIRGINTINTSTDPIYVVDGLVMDNQYAGFNSINLNDVASVEILKDASATAIYGSRGANGAVLITTKKGKKGTDRVSYDGWFGVQQFAKVPKTLKANQLFELRREAYANGYMATNPDGNRQQYINDVVMGSNEVFADYEFEAYRNGEHYDWLDEVTRTGIQQNHSVSLSGGSDQDSYYISFGYAENKGLIEKSGQKKYTGRINADHQIKPWLKVGTNTSFTRTEDSIVEDNVMDKARGANPLLAIDPDLPTLNYQGRFDSNFFNPIRSLQIDNDRYRNRFLSTSFVNLNFLEGLHIRSSFSMDYVEHSEYKYTPKEIYESLRYGTNGEAKHNRDARINWQWDNTISYETSIGKHHINGLFGTSTSKISRNYTYITGTDFATDDFSYYNIGSTSDKEKIQMGSDFITETLISYLIRANYNYDNKYYLTATARYDGSSKFAKGHQWGIFPSFSAAWNLTGEEFMQEQQVFDMLKLRVGYGIVGNQNIDNFAYRSLYYPQVKDNEVAYVSNGRRGTLDVTWEKQKQLNIGVDMAFLNNRIRTSLDAFLIKNDDLLMTRTLPTTSGYKNAIENIGAIENKGIEFTVDVTVVEIKDFTWNMSANISADKNKVTKLYGDMQVLYNVNSDQYIEKTGNLFIGESRNTIYTYKSGGITQQADMERLNKIDFNGRNVQPGDLYVLDMDGSGTITELDKVIIGSTDPKFYGGFSTEFSWKGIQLNAVFNYSYGAKKFSPYYEGLLSSVGNSQASVDLLNAWTPENTNTDIPRVIGGHSYPRYGISDSDYSVQNASFLRLSTMTLSYTFPSYLTGKARLGNVRIYTTGSNLFCITKYKGYDPETGDWYPPSRMLVFGLNLSF